MPAAGAKTKNTGTAILLDADVELTEVAIAGVGGAEIGIMRVKLLLVILTDLDLLTDRSEMVATVASTAADTEILTYQMTDEEHEGMSFKDLLPVPHHHMDPTHPGFQSREASRLDVPDTRAQALRLLGD